ncbi:hypothetical protein ACFL2T_04050 [Elusimicrobiota bacterium]
MVRLGLKKSACILSAAVLAVSLLPPASCAQGLDGTQWRMKRKSLVHLLLFWKADNLIFKDGSFFSQFWRERGFKPMRYVGETSWSCVQVNQYGERLEWQGTRKGFTMRGTVTRAWTSGKKKKKKTKMYRWKAKLRKVPVSLPDG